MIPLYDDNPRTSFPIVTVALIAVNVLVFLWQMSIGDRQYLFTMYPSLVTGAGPGIVPISATEAYRVTAAQVIHPIWLTIFTAMFMHGGWLHIGGNMLYLWIFGDNIEDELGPVKFLVFYLICGVVAAAAQIMSQPASPIPTLGASGAIAGVMGGYILLFPRAQVRALVPVVFFSTLMSVPAYVILGIWFVYQIFLNHMGQVGAAGGGGVAYMAHIGGFIAGLILVKLFGGKGNTQPAYRPSNDWR